MDSKPEVIQLTPGPAIAIRALVSLAELPAFFGAAFEELGACGGDQISGPPFAIYHAFDPQKIDVSAVMPVCAPVPARGRVVPIQLAGGPAVQVKHVGSYDEMGATYAVVENWLAEHHRTRAGAVREMYLSPPTVPPTLNVTLVIQPLEAS